MRGLFAFVVVTSLALSAAATDEIPGAPQTKPILLSNGVIHPIVGKPIQDGSLLFEKGKIVYVGRKPKAPENATTIDLNGQHVYPGLFESMSQIGLVEIAAVRATRDFRESGEFNPNVKARVSFNPDSELIPVTRANGVLLAVSSPSGGRISGQASVMQLDGWTNQDMTLKADVGLLINWPFPPASGDDEELEELTKLFDDASAYVEGLETNQQDHDLRLAALAKVVTGDLPIIAYANSARQIESAVSFCVSQGCRLIILGGHDAIECSELLNRHDVPVIVDSVHRRPRRRHEPYDIAYTLPSRLKASGIRYCISGYDRGETWNARNLPYHAGYAVAFGLDPEEAIKSITLYPAQIFGVADRVGSLEVGKDATLIVTNGNPLETTTSVQTAWVQGRPVQLTSRHTRLRDKYELKYRQSN